MTGRQFYDWQTAGGVNDVLRLIETLERAEVLWCAIGGVAVNHWAREPLVTRDVDLVVAAPDIERVKTLLTEAGLKVGADEWAINFAGKSQVSIQLSTEAFYQDFPSRAVPADVHGIFGICHLALRARSRGGGVVARQCTRHLVLPLIFFGKLDYSLYISH